MSHWSLSKDDASRLFGFCCNDTLAKRISVYDNGFSNTITNKDDLKREIHLNYLLLRLHPKKALLWDQRLMLWTLLPMEVQHLEDEIKCLRQIADVYERNIHLYHYLQKILLMHKTIFKEDNRKNDEEKKKKIRILQELYRLNLEENSNIPIIKIMQDNFQISDLKDAINQLKN